MYRKTKNRIGGNQATLNTSKSKQHFNGLSTYLTDSIITLVVCGWIPMSLGYLIIQRRGKHVN